MQKDYKVTAHMRELCEELGPEYKLGVIDNEPVILCDLGEGFDVEISGANTRSQQKRVNLYLWYDARILVKTLLEVPQNSIGDIVEQLRHEVKIPGYLETLE